MNQFWRFVPIKLTPNNYKIKNKSIIKYLKNPTHITYIYTTETYIQPSKKLGINLWTMNIKLMERYTNYKK